MRILLAGASGFIGARLIERLEAAGHEIRVLSRTPNSGQLIWDPQRGVFDPAHLEGVQAVINLCGESIAARWTETRKKAILASRIRSTSVLAKSIAGSNNPPRIFLLASATGYYGDSGEEELDEGGKKGQGFLSDVVQQWEQAAHVTPLANTRTIYARFGVVLGKEGGALRKMLPVFRLGFGGRIGSGCQYMSWISIEDLLRGIEFLLLQDSVSGVVNICSPTPVTNIEFVRTLARILKRPAIFPVPRGVIRLLFGQMGEETLLFSTRAIPKRLELQGFEFSFPTLEKCLEFELRA